MAQLQRQDLQRRDWLRLAAVTSVASAVKAQPADDLAAAKAAQQSNRAALAKVKVEMAVEPAFSFKA
jgi:hypothetical protein